MHNSIICKISAALLLTCVMGCSLAQEKPDAQATAKTQTAAPLPDPKVGAGVSTSSGSISSMIDTTLSYLGVRYRWGGNGPSGGGFDCSGLIKKVFGDSLGMNLPRTAAQIARLGEKVGRQDLQPGDLVFFNTLHQTFSHVGIYLGENKFVHAPTTGSNVRIDNITESYWNQRFSGGRRLLIPDASADMTPQKN
jgi:cell wall-associated NlpC family hydrolase